MPRKIEATVSPDLYNMLKAETKRRGRRLHVVAGELLLERLTLEADSPATPETLSTSTVAPTNPDTTRGSGSSGSRSRRPRGRTARDPDTEGSEA